MLQYLNTKHRLRDIIRRFVIGQPAGPAGHKENILYFRRHNLVVDAGGRHLRGCGHHGHPPDHPPLPEDPDEEQVSGGQGDSAAGALQ